MDAQYTGREGDRIDGALAYRSLGAAWNAAPPRSATPVLIEMRAGRYHEKLSIDKPNIWLFGAGRERRVITFDASAATPGPAGKPLGTRGSFTLRVTAPDFRAEHLTIENAYDYDANARRPESDPARIQDTQGVALAMTDGSDRAVLEDVRLAGHQDTFFADAGRQYLHHCQIIGNVDFIFGAGRAVFDECEIVSLDRGSATNNGYIVAPSTDIAQPYGFLFVQSRLVKGFPTMAEGTASLGRPWHPFATLEANPAAVFVDCWMDDDISAKGWERMSAVDAQTQVRYWYEPANTRFYEFRSTGPGARTSTTRRALSDGDARSYSIARVLGGWIPRVNR